MYTTHDDRNVADRTRTYGEGRGCAIEDPQNNRCAGGVAVLDRVQRNFSEGEACLWQHLHIFRRDIDLNWSWLLPFPSFLVFELKRG